MATGYDPSILSEMGIEETTFDFPLPLYVRYQMTPYTDGGLQLFHAQPRPLSEVALIRLVCQIKDLPKFLRFIRLPRITLAGSTVCPGPASLTYYEVPPSLRNLPHLNYPGRFRAELSLAYSRMHNLVPHAIILSYLENKSLTCYIDYKAYALSASFYEPPRSPTTDLLNTFADVVACRRLFARSQLPHENSKDDSNDDT